MDRLGYGRTRGRGTSAAGCRRLLHSLRRGPLLALASSVAVVIAAAAPTLAEAVTLSPMPGTPDASPTTQISILGTSPSNIASVSVSGSLSGLHAGQLEAYSNGQGASFVLNTPLTEGEEVRAVVELGEGAVIEDSFDVAHLSEPSPRIEAPGEKPEDQEHFVSEPSLRPPKVKVNVADPSLKGDIFLDPLPSPIIHVGNKLLEFEPVGPNGLMILNPEGKLLWWKQFPHGYVGSNLELTSYEGQPALAWWQGTATEAAYGKGEGVIANTSYEPIAYIRAGNGYEADIHELNITPQGTAFVEAYGSVCLPVCSPSQPPVLDSVIQEIDIHTGLVMWEWHALGHVPLSDTEVEAADGVFDPYHVNSIQPLPENRILISLRDTSAIYDVDLGSGSILWTLGGKDSSFAMKPATRFYFQHDARLQGSKLTLFDDEAGPPVHGLSRGLVLTLSFAKKRALLSHQYLRTPATVAVAEGSAQQLPEGNFMVGFGATPYFSEFSRRGAGGKRGQMIFDAELPKGDGTYRVFRFPWTGTPKTLPAIAAERESINDVDVYASWNGATDVSSWEVLAGEDAQSLTPVASAPWNGFETKISVPTTESTFEVRALDSKGRVLATSGPVSAP